MLLRELLNKLDKSEGNRLNINLQKLYEEAFRGAIKKGEIPKDSNHDIKAYYAVNWIDNNIMVGGIVYFLRDELMCTSTHNAFDEDKYFEWISPDTYLKLKDYLESFLEGEYDLKVDYLNLDEEMDEGIVLEEVSMLPYKCNAMYKDMPCKIRSVCRITNNVKIELPSSITLEVGIEKLLILYNIDETDGNS